MHIMAILHGLNTDWTEIEYVTMFSIRIGLISPFHQSRYQKAT